MVALNLQGNHLNKCGIGLFYYIILFENVDRGHLSGRQSNVIKPDVIDIAFKVATPVHIERAGIIG